MTKGTIVCANNRVFAGCNSVRQLANLADIPAKYVHPSTKVCNYTSDTSFEIVLTASGSKTIASTGSQQNVDKILFNYNSMLQALNKTAENRIYTDCFFIFKCRASGGVGQVQLLGAYSSLSIYYNTSYIESEDILNTNTYYADIGKCGLYRSYSSGNVLYPINSQNNTTGIFVENEPERHVGVRAYCTRLDSTRATINYTVSFARSYINAKI